MSGAFPPLAARPLGRAGGVPRPLCPGCGWCGRGDPAPAPQRAPLRGGVAHCGGGGSSSPVGVPRAVVKASEVRRFPTPDCPPFERAVRVRYPRAVGAGARVWGSSTIPLACVHCGGCAPRGWWGTVPGGGGLPPLRGASGVRRCPSLGRRSSGAGSRDSAIRVSRVRLVRVWGPCIGPTACGLAGRHCALLGWRKGVPGGGYLPPL